MPRSSKLKNVGPDMSGQHNYVTCFCCHKSLRQDHFARHFASHINKLKVDTAQAFADKYETFSTLNDVIICEFASETGDKYPAGACFECHKYISNPTPSTTDVFDEHLCKDKKKAIVEKEAIAPSDFKTLWKNIGKEKMSDNMKSMYEVLGTMPTISYSEKIQTMFGRALSSKTPATGDASFKAWARKLLGFEAFTVDDDEEEIKKTIIEQCELAEQLQEDKEKMRVEIRQQLYQQLQKDHHEELEELRDQIANYRDQIRLGVGPKPVPYTVPTQMPQTIQHY